MDEIYEYNSAMQRLKIYIKSLLYIDAMRCVKEMKTL